MLASASEGRSPIPAEAGIGLRFQHHGAFIRDRPDVAWLEVHTENYMGGGPALQTLERLRQDYTVSLHGVGLSLGSADGLDKLHLQRIRAVAQRLQPALISEHLSWSAVGGVYLADLLPLPMTEEALQLVCRHVRHTQDYLQRQLLIENPSTYLQYRSSTIPEWEFMAAVAADTGCGLLCDVNNLYVSAENHGWDAQQYLDGLPSEAIQEIHLAGHSRLDAAGRSIRIDDHGSPVSPDVWSLYVSALERWGSVPTLIEWDNDVPPLEVLLEEARTASSLLRSLA